MKAYNYTGTKAGFLAWVAERERESVMRSWFDKNPKIWAAREKELDEITKESE